MLFTKCPSIKKTYIIVIFFKLFKKEVKNVCNIHSVSLVYHVNLLVNKISGETKNGNKKH